MRFRFFISFLDKLFFFSLVEVLSIDRIEFMSLPEGLSSFKSLNIDVCLFFLVMVLQISIRYNIVFSQSREINFLASDELNSNEQRL